MARTPAGTAGATARAVVGRTAMTKELADGPGRRRGSQPRCGNSSWTRPTTASRSGNTARSWAALQSGVGAYQDRPGVVKEIGGGLDGNPPGRPPPCDGCQVLPATARKPVVIRHCLFLAAPTQRHPQIRADRVSSVLAGDWDGSGESIASRQAQRACPPAHVVKVTRFVGSTVGAAGRLGVG
jgi:hypothetical protein